MHTMNDKKHLGRVVCELMCTERMHRTAADSRMSALGIHRNQHTILMELARAERTPGAKALVQRDLAQRFGISAAAIAMMLKKMEAEGYIRRVMSQDDNRFNELYLTDYGREILSRSHRIFDELDRQTYQGLTEEELDVMMRCLARMQENLRAMPELEGFSDPPKQDFKKKP